MSHQQPSAGRSWKFGPRGGRFGGADRSATCGRYSNAKVVHNPTRRSRSVGAALAAIISISANGEEGQFVARAVNALKDRLGVSRKVLISPIVFASASALAFWQSISSKPRLRLQQYPTFDEAVILPRTFVWQADQMQTARRDLVLNALNGWKRGGHPTHR
jgi:hypothetical protein